jgi:hypothetical protein
MYFKQRTSEYLAMNYKQKLKAHHYKEISFNVRLAKVTIYCENLRERRYSLLAECGNFGN